MLITRAGILWDIFPLLLYQKWEYPQAILTILRPSLLFQVMDWASFMFYLDSFLSTGCVQDYFKSACVQRILKSTTVIEIPQECPLHSKGPELPQQMEPLWHFLKVASVYCSGELPGELDWTDITEQYCHQLVTCHNTSSLLQVHGILFNGSLSYVQSLSNHVCNPLEILQMMSHVHLWRGSNELLKY